MAITMTDEARIAKLKELIVDGSLIVRNSTLICTLRHVDCHHCTAASSGTEDLLCFELRDKLYEELCKSHEMPHLFL